MSAQPQIRANRGAITLAITALFALVGLAFAGYGLFVYGFWTRGGPGAGFFPTVFGGAMAALALTLLFRREADLDGVRLKNFLPPVAVVVAVLLLPVFGMIVTMTLFVVAWLKVWERSSWLASLAIGIGTGIAVYLVFSIWLQVSFPDSLLFDRI